MYLASKETDVAYTNSVSPDCWFCTGCVGCDGCDGCRGLF